MTTYAHHPSASSIIATWPTGAGAVAERVARIPASCDDARARHLAQALDRLSSRIWISYFMSVESVPEPSRLSGILRRPNNPVGMLLKRADDDVDEAAHAVGRLLVEIDDRGCREAVVREVEKELAAVRSAFDDDMTGRAQQAVTRIRPVPDSDQVARAQALLHEVPLGSERLFTEVGPTAACVAAFEWLVGTVAVTDRRGRYGSTTMLLQRAQLLSDRSLHIAMALFADRTIDARELIVDVLREAMLTSAGVYVALRLGDYEQAYESDGYDDYEGYDDHEDYDDYEQYDDTGPDEDEIEEAQRKLTALLQPADPGRSLLEGIITGIQACFELYLEDTAEAEVPDPDPRLTGPHWSEEIRQRFDAEVREAVETNRKALRG
ncbi:hypothetical protein WIS52_22530 [Pseudonocardia nematodicida]|uniref:Uncharacterized protein n=1 Tax=Pseudonocardia nematodicida TaxID=1206997 RepID=A0ABV1KFM0_9PSEU